MPTYTYECKKCANTFDVFHAMTASPKVKCPVCGGAGRRLLGAGAGLIFKGSGFYETDYKRKPTGNGSQKTEKSSGASTTAESAGGKTDSKPAAKEGAST